LMPMEPRIVPRKEHRISRKHVSPNALRTLYRLHSRGFIAYLVGGCVRDLLLGRTPKDFDIGTNATPGQIKRLFHNCRLVGRRFRLAHLRFQDEIVEVSTFRRSADPSDAVEPDETTQGRRHVRHMKDANGMVLADNIFGTPEEDALRRDFTINALAYNIADASVVDYCTGLADLKDRLIRSIGDPRVRFTEDPVRMLRAVRFAASHGFDIETTAWESIRELCSTISRVSPSRLYEEIQKLFLPGFACPTFALLETSGLLASLFPDLAGWMRERDGHLEVLGRNLAGIDEVVRDGQGASVALLLAALFGPRLEEAALFRHREGIPRRQALDETCAGFLKEISESAHIPGRVGARLNAILALKTSLCRMPPRRPSTLADRPEFAETLMYLKITAGAEGERQAALAWWKAYLLENPPAEPAEAPAEETPRKKRRRRRRKPRRRGGETVQEEGAGHGR
jgi:poly(A) polymerase